MTFRAGAAETVITPPVGTLLSGYGARIQPSVGVHDDLHARALVFDDGVTQAAIVACDLIGIDRRLAAQVRQIGAAATGVAPANIMVCATHTHGGPTGLRPQDDEALTEVIGRLIAGAIIEAHASIRPAVLKAGGGSVDTVQQNRRHPDWPIDPHLGVLLVDSPDPREGPTGSIVNFACHPTVMFQTNLHITSDYAGYTIAAVRKLVGDAPALFLNGACANTNPAWTEQTFAEAERVGSIVGAEAARRLLELRPLGSPLRAWNIRWDELIDRPITTGVLIGEPRLTVASRDVEVRLRRLDEPRVYDAQLTALRRELESVDPDDVQTRRSLTERMTMLAGTRGVAAQLRSGAGTLHPEVQAIGFGGGVAILGLPGEFFVETGQAIRTAAGVPHLMISCYTNHHVMYVVPREAWPQGGYEPGVSILDEHAEEVFRSAAIDILESVSP